MTGTSDDDVICRLGGDDVIDAGEGSDTVLAGIYRSTNRIDRGSTTGGIPSLSGFVKVRVAHDHPSTLNGARRLRR